MSLIRFDGDDIRGPSAELWRGIADWPAGSNTTYLGQRDFEDFAPYTGPTLSAAEGRAGGTHVMSLGDDPNVTLLTDRFGVIEVTEGNATDESVGLARDIWYDLQNSELTVVEARVEAIADANTVVSFVGFFDGEPHAVFASGVVAVGSNQDTIGLRWNDDETIDIVAVDDGGTLAVLKDDIGITRLRTDGPAKLGLRIEKTTPTQYRLTPCVDGVIARAGAVNVLATALPENPMRPVVVQTVASTTDPKFELDWIFSADK